MVRGPRQGFSLRGQKTFIPKDQLRKEKKPESQPQPKNPARGHKAEEHRRLYLMRWQKVQKILRPSQKGPSDEWAEPYQLIIRPDFSQNQLPSCITELQLYGRKHKPFQRSKKQDKNALNQSYKLVWSKILETLNTKSPQTLCVGRLEREFRGKRKWRTEL